jgi:hypothetical protein
MLLLDKIVGDIECHDLEGIRACFKNGVNPNDIYKNEPLFLTMINMYFRGPLFKNCIELFVEYGLDYDDKALIAVLLDDAIALESLLKKDGNLIFKKYNFDCTFTPLFEASLLHICAEYNHVNCAKILVKFGLDKNVKAGIDENGFGGQTPIFHTVNQRANYCIDMLKFLIGEKADLSIEVKGLIWGKSYEWETYIPTVNLTSYAMMGLLRQFQRTENDVYTIVRILQKEVNKIDYFPKNVPNKYLES